MHMLPAAAAGYVLVVIESEAHHRCGCEAFLERILGAVCHVGRDAVLFDASSMNIIARFRNSLGLYMYKMGFLLCFFVLFCLIRWLVVIFFFFFNSVGSNGRALP